MSQGYLFPKNARVRAFVLDKREIIEVIAAIDGRDYIQYHGEFNLGESAAEFLYGNYDGIFDFLADSQNYLTHINEGQRTEEAWEKLFGHISCMPQAHPYWGMALQALSRLYDGISVPLPASTLSNMAAAFKTVQADILVLASQCLNTEQRQDRAVTERYATLLQMGCFPMRELTWQRMRAEIVPVEAVPPRKRGLMPELLTAEELHERGIKTAFAEVLYPESIIDLYCFLKAAYLRHGVCFKPCRHCGRYFAVTGSSAVEYCNRPIPGSTKTCRQIGAIRIYQSRQLENPAIKAFTKSYKTHNARVRYGTLTREQFAAWSKEARERRDECVSGKLPLAELQEWLDNN